MELNQDPLPGTYIEMKYTPPIKLSVAQSWMEKSPRKFFVLKSNMLMLFDIKNASVSSMADDVNGGDGGRKLRRIIRLDGCAVSSGIRVVRIRPTVLIEHPGKDVADGVSECLISMFTTVSCYRAAIRHIRREFTVVGTINESC